MCFAGSKIDFVKGVFNLLLLLFCLMSSAEAQPLASHTADSVYSDSDSADRPQQHQTQMSSEQWNKLIAEHFPYATEREMLQPEEDTRSEDNWTRFFESLRRRLQTSSVRWLLGSLAAIVMLWAVFKWIYPGIRPLLRRRISHRSAEDPAERKVPDTDGQLERELDAYLQAGDYRNATRMVYLIVLGLLMQHGWIHLRDEFTDEDYYRALPADHSLKPLFRRLLIRYHYAWFGAMPVSSGQWADTHILFEDIKLKLGA